MVAPVSNLVRKAHSEILFRRVEHGIPEWLENRCDIDTRNQYSTQLSAIGSVLQRILDRLDEDRKRLDPAADSGTLYASCERFERRILWLERLWRFFRSRFDQRDDSELRPVLQAADEMVWSCYSAPIQKATALGLRSGPAPAPLPFIEAKYSPEAFPIELVPPDLKDEIEAAGLLREYLNRMPVPVVRMTPACVAGPWWLVYLAHETGHHVQYDLLPDHRLVEAFRDAIETAVKEKSGSDSLAKMWRGWSKEIFADLFSVICMGASAVWAMVELELKPESQLNEERDSYPSPSVRLALLAEACDRVTGAKVGTKALRGLIHPASDEVRKVVLDTALGALPAVGETLADLCRFDVANFDRNINWWRELFLKKSDEAPNASPETARVLTGAALGAWESTAAKTPETEIPEACKALAARYTTAMVAGAPDGERASEEYTQVDELAGQFMETIWKETQ